MTDAERLAKAKARIGIPDSVTSYDEEIADLLVDSRKDILAAGVPERLIDDEMFFNTQMLYVRAHIGNDRSDTNRYVQLYQAKVFRLALEEGGT